MKPMAAWGVMLVFLAVLSPAVAGEKEQAPMHGMSGGKAMEGHGSMAGAKGEAPGKDHGMMAMGDRVFDGKIGPWQAEARLIDMKAQMEKAKVSEKMKAMMKNTHHLSVALEDPGTKTPVTKGKGTVTVVGPGGTRAEYGLTGMQGHFGSDVTLDKPGKYAFIVRIESEGKKGEAAFDHEVK